MKFKQNFFKSYIQHAPLPLALERSWECAILSQQEFKRPILDIGCGEGIFAHNLFQEKMEVGLDANSQELKRARQYEGYHEYIASYAQDIKKPNASFDTILCNSALEHMEDIESVLKEMHRLLTDHGTLYLTLPTHQFERYTILYQLLSRLEFKGLAQKYAQFFNRFWRHFHCYPCDQWEALFTRFHFKVKKRLEYGSKSACLLNDLLVPFTFIAYVTKKLTNRWFLSKSLREWTSLPLYGLFAKQGALQTVPPGQGGLIFYALQKA